MFKFGKSEADLVKSIPGLVCSAPQTNLWGPADRSCVTSGEVIPGVAATIVFNLRADKFVSVVLVIDRSNMGALLSELTKRHGKPSLAIPSIVDPEKVVWLYEKRVLILEKSPTAEAEVSSLLVSADESILEQARSLVARLQGTFSRNGLSAN